MLHRRTLTIIALLATLLGASGCKKKKPPVPPPQATVPTIIRPAPDSTSPGPPPPVSVEPSRPLPTPGESTSASVQKPAPKPKTHIIRKTVPPPPPEPPKKTVEASSPTNQSGQLTASTNRDQALHQQVDTAQLITTAENTLRGLTRQLSTEEQAMVQHIRSFIKQSQTATSEGDLERAYNLAFKAHQLSDELVKK